MKKFIGTASLFSVVCLALTPIATAHAANWVYVTTSRSNAVFYYDSDTIQRSGYQVIVWQKTDYSRDKTIDYRETKSRYRYDCSARTVTLLQGTAYYPDGKNETFVYKTYEQETRAVTPDTVQEELLEAACR